MEFPALHVTTGAVFLFLATVIAWLAFRLKLKNEVLKETICELEFRSKKAPTTNDSIPVPPPALPKPSAFLDAFLWMQIPQHDPAPIAGRMLDESDLRRLLQTETRFTGLVVLIGIEEHVRQTAQHDQLMQSAGECVESLLSNGDLGCRSGHHEFLVICPGRREGEAQRRLNEISEQLWNFQLQGHGAFSVLFSWGGIGVDGEPLSDAIASAMDRLQQTKRNRKLFFMESASPKRRRAV